MQPIAVQSRIIQSVFFSQADGQLRILFKNGEERIFTGVDEQAVLDMVNAPSPGQHYINSIRGAYPRIAA